MKILRLLIIFSIAVACGLAVAGASDKHATPQHDPHTKAAHGDAHGHGEDASLGETLVGILEHHLVDAQHMELFGFDIHLPTFEFGEYKFALTKHRLWWLIALTLMGLVVWLAARQKSEVPTGLRNALEGLVLFVRNEVVKPNLHEKTDAFMPYFMSLFCGILFSNLLGLLLGEVPPLVTSMSQPALRSAP
ncbi:MAG: F0F1 ATP synthase subunit A [bacterium]|nr:F0F1 ATP synthase subunit A [bacterium]